MFSRSRRRQRILALLAAALGAVAAARPAAPEGREMENSPTSARQRRLAGDTLRAAFAELTRLYHAENAHSMPIKPPAVPQEKHPP